MIDMDSDSDSFEMSEDCGYGLQEDEIDQYLDSTTDEDEFSATIEVSVCSSDFLNVLLPVTHAKAELVCLSFVLNGNQIRKTI